MKNLLGLSLVVIGGGGIAYILSLKDKKVSFADNLSTKCERLAYEKEKAFGDWQEFNLKTPQPTIDQSKLMAKGDKKELAYWKDIDKQRQILMDKYGIAEGEWAKSFCTLKEKKNDTVDCNRLKENITTNKVILENLKKSTRINDKFSGDAENIIRYTNLIKTDQNLYDKNNCTLNTKSDVNISNATFKECIDIDRSNNQIKDEILNLRKKALTTSGLNPNEEVLLNRLQISLNTRENEFTNKNCRDKIETIRLTDTAVVSTKLAEQMEEQVLGRNEKEKYVYIGVGGLVLLTGLFIILKK